MNWQDIVYHDYFAGVGGFAYGFLQAGIRFREHYFSEIDKHSIAVYKHHFHEAKEVGDITAFSGDGATRPNLLTFGFPCQDLSIAGRRKGIVGERSGLFFHAVRLIEKYLPEVFIFENVAGLLSSNEGQDFEIVLKTIADIGLYDCEWQLVNTRWVLPQNRERIYFVGHLRGTGGFRVFPFRKNDRVFTAQQSERNGALPCITATEYKGPSKQRSTNLVVQPFLTPDRLKKRQNGRRIIDDGEPAFTLTGLDRHGIMITDEQDLFFSDSGKQRKWEENIILPPLMANTGTGYGNVIYQVGRGQNKGGEKPISPTITSNNFANNNLLVANTVTPEGYLNTGERKRDENGKSVLTSQHERRIRRLTEVECERLQGFPDGWTEFGNYDGTVKKVSKTQRYKMMGNAVTTLWPLLIAQRLMENNKPEVI